MSTVALWAVVIAGSIALVGAALWFVVVVWSAYEDCLDRWKPRRVPDSRRYDVAAVITTAPRVHIIRLPGMAFYGVQVARARQHDLVGLRWAIVRAEHDHRLPGADAPPGNYDGALDVLAPAPKETR